ncbi:MAG: response regulator [Acidimicrobiales bacterium]
MTPHGNGTLRGELELLLVDDDEQDVLMVREALEEAGSMSTLHATGDGIEALAFLRGDDPFGGPTRPDLVLLDLNLPRMSGFELLSELKGGADWRAIPVVVLSTSRSDADVRRSYELQASAFVTKPSSFSELAVVMGKIERFYGEVARLPES